MEAGSILKDRANGAFEVKDTPWMNECKFSLQSSFFSLKHQENGTVLTNTWKWEWNCFWIPPKMLSFCVKRGEKWAINLRIPYPVWEWTSSYADFWVPWPCGWQAQRTSMRSAVQPFRLRGSKRKFPLCFQVHVLWLSITNHGSPPFKSVGFTLGIHQLTLQNPLHPFLTHSVHGES